MNRFSPLTAVLLSSFFIQAACAEDALIPDKNLEAVVRQSVFEKRDNDKPLTAEDLEKISTITGRGKGIQSLQGLEHCHSLLELKLPNNEISDVTPLKDLKVLQKLMLNKNKIDDIKPLEGLTALQYLELSDNQVSDVGPLAKMDNMRSLYLSNNKLKDVGPLSELKKTWSLYLDGNEVTNLKPLSGLAWLSVLDLTGNGISDLTPLAPLTELRHLILEQNKISELGTLVEMAKKDLEGKKRFALFWHVYLEGNPLNDTGKMQLDELKKLGVRVQ